MANIDKNEDPPVRVLQHFRQRVAERLGADVDADRLAADIARAVRTKAYDYVSYVGRGNDGTACYRIRLPDGRLGYPIVCRVTGTPITMLMPGFLIDRPGKRRPKRLREHLPDLD